jgi:hypothetical protein
MHPDVVSAKPDNCPKCGMGLVSASEAKTGHAGCCADKSAPESATELRLPPWHPPVPGWTTDAPPQSEPASSNATTHSSH